MQTTINSTSPTEPPSAIEQTQCCSPFDPKAWDGQRIVWQEKLFVADHAHCIFHIPLDLRSRVLHTERLIRVANAAPANGALLLCDMTSPWGAELYFEVARPLPDVRLVFVSGTFITKVYEGSYRDAARLTADMRRRVAGQNERIERLYFADAICPRCAEAQGERYVILFAKLCDEATQAAVAWGGTQ